MDSLLADYQQIRGTRSRDIIIVEGRWNVEALLQSDLKVRSILLVEDQELDPPPNEFIPIVRQTRSQVEALVGFPFHHGVLASADRPNPKRCPATIKSGIVTVCPQIADECNLGAIIRNAAGFGGNAVLVPANHGANVYSRKAIRASSGAVFRIPVHESPVLAADLNNLRANDFPIIAATLDDSAIDIREMPTWNRAVVLFGPENAGLSQDWLQSCDMQIKIPLADGVDSLNVASSSAILLYEIRNGINKKRAIE